MYKDKVALSSDEPFRLFAWSGNSENLVALNPKGTSAKLSGTGSIWHSHPEIELKIVTKGNGMRFVGDHAGPFEQGDCVLLGSYLPHCWVESGMNSGYVLQIAPTVEQHLPGLLPQQRLRELFDASQRGLLFNKELANEIGGYFEQMRKSNAVTLSGLVLLALGQLLELHDGATPLSSIAHNYDKRVNSHRKLQLTVQWINEQFSELLSFEDALDFSGMSRATFSRHFKKYTGLSFTSYLNRTRIAMAYRELTTTNKKITDIAYDSGFGSLSHFNTLFRSHYGISPRSARNANSNKEE